MPIANMQRTNIASIDHLAGAREHGRRDMRPSALAVLILITSSYLVGSCTGRSAGFAPFRSRSMYDAACL